MAENKDEKKSCSVWDYELSKRLPLGIVKEMVKAGKMSKECVHPSVRKNLKD